MPDFGSLLARVARGLDDSGIGFMVIGGQAVLLHGEPRLTQDIDITLGTGPVGLADVLKVCAKLGLEVLPDDPGGFVRRTFVLPTRDPGTGIRIDLIFSTTPYAAAAIKRALRIDIGTHAVPFATPEDLILHKLFAARPRDLEDAASVVRRKGDELDWAYMEGWAADLAKVEGREALSESLLALRVHL